MYIKIYSSSIRLDYQYFLIFVTALQQTTTTLRKTISENPQESRKKWMLQLMKNRGIKNKNNNDFQLWQQYNQPILLDSNYLMEQKLNYIHNNPVKAGIVENPEDYLYSSAKDYAGMKGLVEIEIIE